MICFKIKKHIKINEARKITLARLIKTVLMMHYQVYCLLVYLWQDFFQKSQKLHLIGEEGKNNESK